MSNPLPTRQPKREPKQEPIQQVRTSRNIFKMYWNALDRVTLYWRNMNKIIYTALTAASIYFQVFYSIVYVLNQAGFNVRTDAPKGTVWFWLGVPLDVPMLWQVEWLGIDLSVPFLLIIVAYAIAIGSMWYGFKDMPKNAMDHVLEIDAIKYRTFRFGWILFVLLGFVAWSF